MAHPRRPRKPPPGRRQPAVPAEEARLRTLIDRNADGMLVVLQNGMIAFANPAAQSLLGRAAADLVGRPFGIPIIPEGTSEVDIPLAGSGVRVAEMRAVETVWEGEPAYIASLRDITERRRLEEELRQKAEQLAEADRHKDAFLAVLAHELRNPLAPILHATEILRRAGSAEPLVQKQREVIARQVQQMKRLLDDLLDVSRIKRGQIALRPEPVELVRLVREAAEDCRGVLEAVGLSLELALPAPPVWVQGDPVRLAQVVGNLLANAAKFTDAGGQVTVQLRPAADRRIAAITVRDTGIGIEPEVLPHVFETFVQADRSLDRSRGGLGLGLALVKGLAELHGGQVTAASAGLGRGSEFTVQLPLSDGAPTHLNASPLETAPSDSLRVLVVEDNPDAAETLRDLLELNGHAVEVALSGIAGIEAAQKFLPDVVLCDIGLPGTDGYAVARALRQGTHPSSPRLVALTGYDSAAVRQRSREAGFTEHLVKPVDPQQLVATLAARGQRSPAEQSQVAPEPPRRRPKAAAAEDC